MLLCRDSESSAPFVQVLSSSYSTNSHSSGRRGSVSSVFERLQRAPPPSLSSPAFDAIVTRAQREHTECTFAPHVNHTHDDVLHRWSADSDVFGRLYGHAQCQQEQRLFRREAIAHEAFEEEVDFHQRFKTYTFPYHLYYAARKKKHTSLSSHNSGDRCVRLSVEQCDGFLECFSSVEPGKQGDRGRYGGHKHSTIVSPLRTLPPASEVHAYRDHSAIQGAASTAGISLLSKSAAQKADDLLERMRAARLAKDKKAEVTF